MKTYPNQLIFDNNMRSLLRNGDIEWAVECQITNEGTIVKIFYQPIVAATISQILKKIWTLLLILSCLDLFGIVEIFCSSATTLDLLRMD